MVAKRMIVHDIHGYKIDEKFASRLVQKEVSNPAAVSVFLNILYWLITVLLEYFSSYTNFCILSLYKQFIATIKDLSYNDKYTQKIISQTRP